MHVPRKSRTGALLLSAALMLPGGCLKRQIWLVPEGGPYILAEDVSVKTVGIEDPPGSGQIRWLDGPVRIPKGWTVLWYDWSEPVWQKNGK